MEIESVASHDVSERDAIHDLKTSTERYGEHLSLNLTSSFYSPLTVLLLDLRALETSTENNGTALFIVLSLERFSCFFFACTCHASHSFRKTSVLFK